MIRPEHDVRVLIADDHALIRESFHALLTAEPGFQPVGAAATGAEAVRLAGRLQPDVVLMDVRMPGMDGIEATRVIRSSPETAAVRVLVLTTFDLDEYVYAALRAGASGFLIKDSTASELIDGIRVIAADEALLAPRITRRLIATFARQGVSAVSDPTVLRELTEREREVLVLIARGLSNSEIARDLHVTIGTVKTHVGHVLSKTGARDRTQLVIRAYEAGLVTPGR